MPRVMNQRELFSLQMLFYEDCHLYSLLISNNVFSDLNTGHPSADISPAVRIVIEAHCDMGDTARAHQLFGFLLTCSTIQIPVKTYEDLQKKLIEDGHYNRSARLHNRILRTRRMPAGDAMESFLLALANTGRPVPNKRTDVPSGAVRSHRWKKLDRSFRSFSSCL
mmetsp:Transcript_33886/g.133044  ORF Transcript_33886/g.133044 Transcript_33886/m.133044 type:complete len:166 (+) Transcript_33886:1084-1581(+)